MIDLNDPRTEKIADVISNESAKKILGALAEREMSESELSKELGIKMNTIGYNVKKLEDAGLIEKVKGFLWSVKGKRIHRYKVSDKRIIISPRTMSRGVLPAVIVSGIIALGIKIFVGVERAGDVGEEVVGEAGKAAAGEIGRAGVEEVGSVVGGVSTSSAPQIASGALETGASSIGVTSIHSAILNAPNSWAWFFIGALTALLVLVLWNWRKNDKK